MALIQTTWPDFLKFQEVLPDLSLLLVVYFAIMDGEERAMLTGLIGGVYQDVASDTVLGQHILCLVVIGYAVGRLSTRLITEHPAVKAGLVLLAGLLSGSLFTAIAFVQDPAHGFFMPAVNSVVPGAFYTAIFTPIIFFVLSRIFYHRESLSGGIG